ncbi:MAG: Mfa1 family fimbria major subunit [Muribaculaceae bacterium]|nr:Mfa1 family fimbria major subunit [Muribaculaceae bacterium]MDE6345945.1 Mfa1 family fimbria major subunit [Muribaculaceae bacterium]
MKKALFIAPMMVAVLASCSSDEPTVDNGTQEGMSSFLSVNLVNTPSMPIGRATGDAGNYEDGIGNENKVNTVRFYFFDADGNSAFVKNGTASYLDWTPAGDEAGDAPNVEKTLTATLIINTKEGDKVPASVIAVVNPSSTLLNQTVSTIDGLNDIVADHSAADAFVMSNSVYSRGGSKMEAVSVAGHLSSSAADAIKNPVDIYVERVVAKVRLSISDELIQSNGLISTGKDKSGNEYTFDGEKIYVKFLGWNVTATADKSYLMKSINPAWANNLFGTNDWNYSPYFRSFWAVNPASLNYGYFKFDKEAGAANMLPFEVTADANNWTYIQENAASDFNTGANPVNPTKAIIAAQLVNEQGEPMEFGEWASVKYSVADLKKAMLASSNLYKVTAGETETTYNAITTDDVELVTAEALGVADKETPGRYRVYLQLTETAKAATWQMGSEKDTPATDADKVLKDLGAAQVWEEGYTYYYFDIQHIGTGETGNIGVVRNHLYDAVINTLNGLGTPVYDPDQTIYPEKPENDGTYIAARINILSWRYVYQDIDLDWK